MLLMSFDVFVVSLAFVSVYPVSNLLIAGLFIRKELKSISCLWKKWYHWKVVPLSLGISQWYDVLCIKRNRFCEFDYSSSDLYELSSSTCVGGVVVRFPAWAYWRLPEWLFSHCTHVSVKLLVWLLNLNHFWLCIKIKPLHLV